MANGKFAGGNGSKENPFLIEDAFDLDAVRNNLNASYKLINDINLNVKPFNEGEGWEGIDEFEGILYGNGHTIKKLYINNSTNSGLFGCLKKTSVIENLCLNDVDITNQASFGALCYSTDGMIKNCCVTGGNIIISYKVGSGSPNIGGVASCLYGTMTNCYISDVRISLNVYGGVSSKSEAIIGGLVGYCAYGKIINCYSGCSMDFVDVEKKGGLVGNVVNGTIINSYWDIESSKCSFGGNGEGKTAEQLRNIDTFIGWRDEKLANGKLVWKFKEGQFPKMWFEKNKMFLLRNHNKTIYSIENSIIYSINQNELNNDIFEKFGFRNEQLLNINTFKGQIRVKNQVKCHDGTLFSYKMDDWIKNITVGHLEKKTEVYYFLKRQNELLSINKIYTEKSDNKKFFVIKNIGNESELSKNFISKDDIIKYGVSKIQITDELMEELKECEIIKWVSDEKEDKLHIQGEYKDRIFKIFKDGELLLWTDDTDVESATLNGEIEPLNILEKNKEYELLAWVDDDSVKGVEILYETEPYRPIDKLDDEFEILKYEITDDDE